MVSHGPERNSVPSPSSLSASERGRGLIDPQSRHFVPEFTRNCRDYILDQFIYATVVDIMWRI